MRKLLLIFICVILLFAEYNAMGQISDSLYNSIGKSLRPADKKLFTDNERAKLVQNISGSEINYAKKEIDEIAEVAKRRLSESNDIRIKIVYATALTHFYIKTSNYAAAFDYCNLIVKYAGNNTKYYNDELMFAYTRLASFYSIRIQPDSAINYLYKAKEIGNPKDSFFLAGLYNGYESIYYNLALYSKTIEYAKKGNDVLPYTNPWWHEDYMFKMLQIALYYNYLYRDTRENKYADSSKQIVREVFAKAGNRSEIWFTNYYYILGQLSFYDNQYRQAFLYYDSALMDKYVHLNIRARRIYPRCKLERAICLVKMGDKDAIKILDTTVLNDRDFFSYQLKYKTLYEHARQTGDWKNALAYFENYQAYTDSLNIIKNRGHLFETEQKYALAEKQATINELENKALLEDKKQSTINFIAIIITLVLLSVIFALNALFKQKQLKQTQEKQELIKTITKIEADFNKEREVLLESQINLLQEQRRKISNDIHDGINSGLAALKFHIINLKDNTGDKKVQDTLTGVENELQSLYLQARDVLKKLETEENDISYSVTDLLIQLKEKFERVSILKINTSFSKELVDNSLLPGQQKHLYMIIKEAITNAIKYSGTDNIGITITTSDTDCTFIIKDNGKGFNTFNVVEGIGLKSMQARIKELKGNISIKSGKQGTSIEGAFPLC